MTEPPVERAVVRDPARCTDPSPHHGLGAAAFSGQYRLGTYGWTSISRLPPRLTRSPAYASSGPFLGRPQGWLPARWAPL